MRTTDVVIVGGGLAGSLSAAMLGRAGIDAVMIDPNPVYPPEFRCEKLDGDQMKTVALTGLVEPVLRNSTPDRESWVARFGRVVEKRPGDQQGLMYDTLVNTMRAQIPPGIEVIEAKAVDILTGPDRQVVQLSNDTEVSGRLVILANGLNINMQQKLGIERTVISPRHSISIGFDVVPVGVPAFPFPALTYYAERPTDQMALITLFPIGSVMRANLFAYRDPRDPWFEQLRSAPEATLHAMWPGLRAITGEFAVKGPIKVRPVDLYVTTNYLRDGLVLAGDAFSTSCPAAGTGARKALVDVERLCNVHIPHWLASPGMSAQKIAQFYDDPVKQACEQFCVTKAFSLREFSTSTALPWVARRWAKFALQWGRGTLRHLTRSSAPAPQPVADAGSQALGFARSRSAPD